ncbi:hypothetical protein MKW98_015280 [Papaver atlanticum]|uniref:Uncharacterized protein n=1 Tax=Papaver atlanticum TaxID=357466 RepID=A0AAD4XNV4_9MAGN|nr:hypothetical protein MKW98_015280 [Papaver atlanticum]
MEKQSNLSDKRKIFFFCLLKRDCCKAYHPDCVGKDPQFCETGGPGLVTGIAASIVVEVQNFIVLAVRKPVCKHCVKCAEFVKFREKKSFCGQCLKVLLNKIDLTLMGAR